MAAFERYINTCPIEQLKLYTEREKGLAIQYRHFNINKFGLFKYLVSYRKIIIISQFFR